MLLGIFVLADVVFCSMANMLPRSTHSQPARWGAVANTTARTTCAVRVSVASQHIGHAHSHTHARSNTVSHTHVADLRRSAGDSSAANKIYSVSQLCFVRRLRWFSRFSIGASTWLHSTWLDSLSTRRWHANQNETWIASRRKQENKQTNFK